MHSPLEPTEQQPDTPKAIFLASLRIETEDARHDYARNV